jgi:tRNA-Thr(GGU) m(6)t(6)A37 methyltransferase TsaA
MELRLHPIGFVHNDFSTGGRDIEWQDVESEIMIEPEWTDALTGIQDFSHLWVIFYFTQSSQPATARTRPQGRADAPLVGRFATRSPVRPNPIGMTPVELLAIRGSRLRVRGLDAFDGTPVLDLKPYLPRGDSLPHARVPDWLTRLIDGDDPDE